MKIKKHANGIYYAHLYSEHGTQQVSLKTRNKNEAETTARDARLADIERAAKARILTAETIARLTAGRRVTCNDALDMVEKWARVVGLASTTRDRYSTYLRMFFSIYGLGNKPVSSITDEMCDEFVNPESSIKFATRRARHAALQTFFQVAVAKGVAATNPVAAVRVKKHDLTHSQKETTKKPPFTPAELRKLKSVDDPFWKAGAVLGDTYGFRISDVARLDWASFSKPGKIIVWADKRDRRIEMDITPEVTELMASIPKTHPTYVFPEQAETSMNDKLRSKHSTYFGRLLIGMGIEGKSFHSFRANFATRNASEGVPVDEIREKMGHVHVETTEGYIHPEN